MTAERQTNESIPARAGAGGALTRRGLVAGAAALVVGVLAKQTATPVGATVTGHMTGDTLIIGANPFSGNTANTSSQVTHLINTVFGTPPAFSAATGTAAVFQGATGGSFGVVGTADSFVNPDGSVNLNQTGTGVYATSAAGIGVHGISTFSPVVGFTGGIGVLGECDNPGGFAVKGIAYAGNSSGVYGSGTTGVYGAGFPYGVTGISSSSSGVGATGQCDAAFGIGVLGKSSSFVAVWGQTDSGVGVLGDVKAGTPGAANIGVQGRVGAFGPNSQNNTIGVGGYNTSTGTGGIGVFGSSDKGNGVYGTTNGTGLVAGLYGTSTTAYGIIGNTTAPFYSGLTATTATTNCAALAATSTNASAFAAYFQGFTYVQGNFAVSGNKAAAVMHPDGTRRLFYCVESPEAWFEDFGEGKLVGGKADVKIDPEFVQFILADAYHVFITPHADTNGLHITGRSATGFTVQEHKGGTNSLSFSWRVVAKRKDNPGKRLEKLTVPKFNLPDPAQLPKLPPSPMAKQ